MLHCIECSGVVGMSLWLTWMKATCAVWAQREHAGWMTLLVGDECETNRVKISKPTWKTTKAYNKINTIFICVQLWPVALPQFFLLVSNLVSILKILENLWKYFKIWKTKTSIPSWGLIHPFFIRITFWGNLFPKSGGYKKWVYLTEHRIKITTWAILTHPPS